MRTCCYVVPIALFDVEPYILYYIIQAFAIVKYSFCIKLISKI